MLSPISHVDAHDIVETIRSALLVLGEDLHVVSANRAFYRLFKAEPKDTIGRSIYQLGLHEWDRPDLRRLLERLIPSDQIVEAFEIEGTFQHIGRRCLVLNGRKVYRPGNHMPFLLLAIDDVTDAREAERRSEQHWLLAQSIVDTVRDPLVILDEDMKVVTASRAFQRFFDVTGAEVLGRHVKDLGEGQWGSAALRALLERINADDTSFDGYEIEDDFPGFGRRIFKLNARRLHHPEAGRRRLMLVFEDVTEARLLERHHDLLSAELAHRIKNSLQIISSFVSFEARHAAEPCIDGFKALQHRISAVAKLYDIISRSALFGPVRADEYLDGIAANLRLSLLDAESGSKILVDAELLTLSAEHALPFGLIVNELATNAVKYAFAEQPGTISIFLRREGDHVLLRVSDDGSGVAEDGLPGLGSRFVDAFVRQIGGILTCDTGSLGTSFTVKFPATVIAS